LRGGRYLAKKDAKGIQAQGAEAAKKARSCRGIAVGIVGQKPLQRELLAGKRLMKIKNIGVAQGCLGCEGTGGAMSQQLYDGTVRFLGSEEMFA
jgi:hypothetical protein